MTVRNRTAASRLGLPGPSRRITVTPEPVTAPPPEREPMPEREPAPVPEREPEKVPA